MHASKIPDHILQLRYDNTTSDAVLNKLKAYDKINEEKRKNRFSYKYNPIKLPSAVDKFVDPIKYAKPSATDTQQVGELIRMAKMTARTARRNKDDAGYDQERQTFMRTYGTQISKYNLYTKLNEIFNLFSDINPSPFPIYPELTRFGKFDLKPLFQYIAVAG